MLRNFQITLLFSAMIYLGLCGSGFAHDSFTDTAISKNTSSHTPLLILTRQQFIDYYDAGVTAGATHMLMVWDTYDFEDSENFIVYSYPGEDVNDLIKYYNAPGFYRVSAVFAMHLDINQQLSDKRWYPEYP